MVSTRGVKFKFSEGEKVLCYEPDPTKAKVLYDSKVLELVVSRDSRGRKVPEYLIHFSRWNSSWDRCVKEELILPDTEENRNLQTKLAKEAALCLKGKRKGKLPPIIKETLVKKECMEDAKAPSVTADMPTEESTSESESSDEEMEKTIEIEIPSVLKEQLEEDWYYITQKDKIIKLPCEQNVVSILESYVKHLAVQLLCATPLKNSKSGKEFVSQNVETKLDICKEVMDGIRIYFDFTLPHLLLYCQEKKQYYTVGTVCTPMCELKSETSKINQKIVTAETEREVPLNVSHAQKEQPKTTSVSIPQVHNTWTRGSLRNQAANQKLSSSASEEVNGTNSSTAKPKGFGRNQQTKDSPGPSTRGRKPKATGPKRILRSNDKQKVLDENTSNVLATSSATSGPESDNVSPTRPESPIMPTSPSRQTRKSSQSSPLASAAPSTSGQNNRSPSGQRRMVNTNAVNNTPSQSTVNAQLPLTISVSTVSSSASSTHSSLSSPRLDSHPYSLINDSGMLSDILSWRILPQNLYDQVPAAPSLIYGAQHLLRLFVKLPELIYKMNMPQRKLSPLLDNLDSFLEFLSEKKDEIFLPSAYIDSCDFPEGSSSAFS